MATKILACDMGDKWVGTAISDTSLVFARPLKTVSSDQLIDFIKELTNKEQIKTIIIGYPKTMSGTESTQTKKVSQTHKELSALFPTIKFILWDERLSSKRAEALAKARTKEEKLHAHSIAAAFILDSYLGYLIHQKEMENPT